MTSSLVGSEMCIRDSAQAACVVDQTSMSYVRGALRQCLLWPRMDRNFHRDLVGGRGLSQRGQN
eukprot:3948984-Prorocentrum_lima.AAC.1